MKETSNQSRREFADEQITTGIKATSARMTIDGQGHREFVAMLTDQDGHDNGRIAIGGLKGRLYVNIDHGFGQLTKEEAGKVKAYLSDAIDEYLGK